VLQFTGPSVLARMVVLATWGWKMANSEAAVADSGARVATLISCSSASDFRPVAMGPSAIASLLV
jgi:hypothetical protein